MALQTKTFPCLNNTRPQRQRHRRPGSMCPPRHREWHRRAEGGGITAWGLTASSNKLMREHAWPHPQGHALHIYIGRPHCAGTDTHTRTHLIHWTPEGWGDTLTLTLTHYLNTHLWVNTHAFTHTWSPEHLEVQTHAHTQTHMQVHALTHTYTTIQYISLPQLTGCKWLHRSSLAIRLEKQWWWKTWFWQVREGSGGKVQRLKQFLWPQPPWTSDTVHKHVCCCFLQSHWESDPAVPEP